MIIDLNEPKRKLKQDWKYLVVAGPLVTYLAFYTAFGVYTKDWSLKNYKSYTSLFKESIKKQIYQNNIIDSYESSNIFQSAKTPCDSIYLADSLGVSYKLILKPSFEDKERVVELATKSLDSSLVD